MADPLTDFQTKQLFISSIGAFITLSAVLVAMFKDWFWNKVRRPVLNASFEMKSPYCTKTLVSNTLSQRPFDAYYFRLRVSNNGSVMATGVQVYINRIKKKHPDGLFHDEKRFQPMNLKWAGPIANNIKDSISVNILPGMSRYCDLGHVFDPTFRQFYMNVPGIAIPGEPDTLLFELELEVQPFTGGHLLKQGEYQIDLQIASENSKPVTKELFLNFLGPWTTAENVMFENAIGIRF